MNARIAPATSIDLARRLVTTVERCRSVGARPSARQRCAPVSLPYVVCRTKELVASKLEIAGQLLAAVSLGEPSMIGMLQILTYMFAFYLIVKGIEVLQVGLASSRGSRVGPILLGLATLVACIAAAMSFVWMQDKHASVLNMPTSGGASLDVSPSFGSLPDPETQAEWARGRDARNKGWKWAEERQLSDDAPCAQLGNTDELTGCKAYVNTFGDRNR